MPFRKYPLQTAPALVAILWSAGLSCSVLALDASVLPEAGSSPPLAALPTLFDPSAPIDPPAVAAPVAPSQNVTINLINRLVQRGVLTKEDSADLIKQAEEDAVVARTQASAPAVPMAAPEDSVHVTYIPELVKAQMREQIKQDVMTQAREEHWAAPRTLPDWVPHFRFSTDVRVRYEGLFYPDGNDNTGAFPNFNAINTGAPFDVAGTQFSPQYNVDQNRNRFRLRARFGTEVDLGENFSMGLRIGTGESNSPVTQNQTLGVANQGQGGNFSKYSVWLDRAFLKYQTGGKAKGNLSVTVGRFDNPFFTTSRVIWEDEIGFDGLALQGQVQAFEGVKPFFTVGAFPVFNTDLNFASNQPGKFKSEDKYLYAGQVGTGWKVNKDINVKIGVAYYHFQDVEGKLSSPFTPLTAQDAGNTDDSRPSFAQRGNTYRALRNIVPNALNNFGTTNQFQYFGLATPFHELALTGRVDYSHFEPVQISLVGEFVKNLAFDRNAIDVNAVNNRGPVAAGTGAFAGGDTAWFLGLKAGSAVLEKRGDWNVGLSYRYVESDAVVDGFVDSDFGGGGTNLKGYTVFGALALAPRVWLGLRWFSANAIAGPPYKNDIVQFDINARF